jgi:hypothetical protein
MKSLESEMETTRKLEDSLFRKESDLLLSIEKLDLADRELERLNMLLSIKNHRSKLNAPVLFPQEYYNDKNTVAEDETDSLATSTFDEFLISNASVPSSQNNYFLLIRKIDFLGLRRCAEFVKGDIFSSIKFGFIFRFGNLNLDFK